MSKQFKSVPECIYGNPCKMVCVNPQCRKPGFVCANGLQKKQQCALFHQNCEKMAWSELENIIYQNPHTKIPQFSRLQDQMEIFFFDLLKKIKEQHVKFKIWSRAYGYSEQMMNFIHLVNEGHYNQISGVYMNQILSQIFMKEQKKFQAPFFIQDVQKVRNQMNDLFEQLSSLYKNTKSLSQSVSKRKINQLPIVTLDSKITQEVDYIKSLFTKNNVKRFNLLYRASQNKFSADEFHKRCDNIPHTLLLVHTQYGKIIGGYTPLAWNSTKKHWAPDKSLTSFVFSLDLRQRFALNLAQFAVACNPQKGPIYGCCDICIVDKSDQQKSNCQFPISYNNFKYNRSPQTSVAFTGSSRGKFLTKQWEIFQVQLQQ